MTDDDLRYRRQFLLTPDSCAAFSHWRHVSTDAFHVYAHPDVELSVVTLDDAATTLILVGYMLDPYQPEKSSHDLLRQIGTFAGSFDRITDYLNTATGRFVLIVKGPKETWLFHDPCGLRTAYYLQREKKLFVASQPGLFKHVTQLADSNRLSSYLQSDYVKASLEHWIPSGCSLHDGVGHLVPNHALRFSTVEQVRYWPKRPILQRPVDEAVTEVAALLSKLMVAANERFELALALTAGWDSRMLLSALKGIQNQVYFYTLQYRDLNARSADIRIPRVLMSSLGLDHTVIDCRRAVPSSFIDLYQQNTSLAHLDDWGTIAYGLMDKYPQEKVCIKGNCSEIARCFYYKFGEHQAITDPAQLVALQPGWRELPFAREQIENWFSGGSEAARRANMDLLDLFYWEHRMGSWQAQSQLEWDIVQEAYTPFNHRKLLEIMLGVPAKLRCAPDHSLYKMVMKELWPEVLGQPINPPSKASLIKSGLRYMGLYGVAKRLRKKLPVT